GRPIDTENLVVSVDYIAGTDLAGASLGHQQVSELVLGRSLMMASDCQSCHRVNEPSVGPSYTQVASRYKNRPDAVSYLQGKIRQGGSGAWEKWLCRRIRGSRNPTQGRSHSGYCPCRVTNPPSEPRCRKKVRLWPGP